MQNLLISSDTPIVIMGVSGSGKSTLGERLASLAGRRFIDGDDLHPQVNVAKMASGTALTDDDRWPWLERVAAELGSTSDPAGTIISCSALRRVYRDFIRARLAAPVAFICPVTPPEILLGRMKARASHYMPPKLLQSQIDTLELPETDEWAIMLDGTETVEMLIARIIERMPER